jgi:hypothetical protein
MLSKSAGHCNTCGTKYHKTDNTDDPNTRMSLKKVPFRFDGNSFFYAKIFTKSLAGEPFIVIIIVIFPNVTSFG